MKKKAIIVALVVVVAVVLLVLFSKKDKNGEADAYEFTDVLKGDLEAIISSTGTLNPVKSVQVGTQVSGKLAEIHADFNDRVRKGELLAQLDTSFLQMSLTEAEASHERSRVQLQQAELDYKRVSFLFGENIKTQNDLDQADINLKVAKANFKTAESSLKKARINLSYASIYSPVDGIVISRDVDVGQTVAASLQAPTLFVIAEDLKKMQIETSVDESDIGQIREKMKARFSVQAYADRKYFGSVSQIRLQPTVNQNVVTYSVIVEVDNQDLSLLPGMTATVDFILGEARDVFMVANAALKVKPDEKMIQILQERFKKMAADRNGQNGQRSSRVPGQGMRGAMMNGGDSGGSAARKFAFIWFRNEKGELDFFPVRTGLTDGKNTEIFSDKISDGLKVIKSVARPAEFGPRMRMF